MGVPTAAEMGLTCGANEGPPGRLVHCRGLTAPQHTEVIAVLWDPGEKPEVSALAQASSSGHSVPWQQSRVAGDPAPGGGPREPGALARPKERASAEAQRWRTPLARPGFLAPAPCEAPPALTVSPLSPRSWPLSAPHSLHMINTWRQTCAPADTKTVSILEFPGSIPSSCF